MKYIGFSYPSYDHKVWSSIFKLEKHKIEILRQTIFPSNLYNTYIFKQNNPHQYQ